MVPGQLRLAAAARGHGGYDSDFSDEENGEKSLQKTKSTKEDSLLVKPFQKPKQVKVTHRRFAAEEWDREEARKRRFHLISMDAAANIYGQIHFHWKSKNCINKFKSLCKTAQSQADSTDALMLACLI